jgi:aspartate aminotransferase-like enzyme
LGFVSDRDILSCIASLEVTLTELGYEDFTPGSGIAAAVRVFSQS